MFGFFLARMQESPLLRLALSHRKQLTAGILNPPSLLREASPGHLFLEAPPYLPLSLGDTVSGGTGDLG